MRENSFKESAVFLVALALLLITATSVTAADTQPPRYSNDTDDSAGEVYEGTWVNVSVKWNDNVSLSTGIFRTNQSGAWTNETSKTFTATPQWFNTSINTTADGGKTICWNQWANDTSNNWNRSISPQCFYVQNMSEKKNESRSLGVGLVKKAWKRSIKKGNPHTQINISFPNLNTRKMRIGGRYDVKLNLNNHSIRSIRIKGLLLDKNASLLRIEKLPKGTYKKSEDSYAINPLPINFSKIIVEAEADAPELYQCKSWNFSKQVCEIEKTCKGIPRKNLSCNVTGGWKKLKDISPGRTYRFVIEKGDPAYAEYDPGYGAPVCGSSESACIAGSSLLKSADSYDVAENNQPNTVDACSDGTSGSTYKTDESVENITVKDLDNPGFQPGDTVEVTTWTYEYDSTDQINFIYSSNANSPSWTVESSIGGNGGWNQYTRSFTLDNVEGYHVVRIANAWQGGTTFTCGSGASAYSDTDDLVFFVDGTPPTFSEASNRKKVLEGTTVDVSVLWNDNGNLSTGVFRTNESGVWNNKTFKSFTGAPGWLNSTIDTSNDAGKVICWNQWANDTSNNWNRSMNNHCFEVVNPPNWISKSSHTPPVYNKSEVSEFNVTWKDDLDPNGYDTALFESNFSGQPKNYTTFRYPGTNISFWSGNLPAGTHYWKFWANDSQNAWNSTPKWTFKIDKAPTETKLFLNGTRNDRYYNLSSIANFTVTSNISGKEVELWTDYPNGTWKKWDSGPEPLTNLTNLTSSGTFTWKGRTTANQNYSSSQESWQTTIGTALKVIDFQSSPQEAEPGDTISKINVTVKNSGNLEENDVNVTLETFLYPDGATVNDWGPQNALNTSCGSLSPGGKCTVSFSSYQVGADENQSGNYSYRISVESDRGLNRETGYALTIHYLPENISSSIQRSPIYEGETTNFTMNITNPWSSALTSVRVEPVCPSEVECTCGGGTCLLGTIASKNFKTKDIVINSSTAEERSYEISAAVNYTNPNSNTYKRGPNWNKSLIVSHFHNRLLFPSNFVPTNVSSGEFLLMEDDVYNYTSDILNGVSFDVNLFNSTYSTSATVNNAFYDSEKNFWRVNITTPSLSPGNWYNISTNASKGEQYNYTTERKAVYYGPDIIPPSSRYVPEEPIYIGSGETLKLTAQGRDAGGLGWAMLSTNETGEWKNKSQNGNYNYTSRKCENAFGISCNETDLSNEGDNTFNTCSPDSDNAYENVRDVQVNVTSVSPGAPVKVTATWDMASDGSTDYLYIWYYNGTGWKQLYRSANSTGSGLYTDSVTFTADKVYREQWVRAYISGYGTDDGDSCSDTSSYYDNDDVNFTVKHPIEFDGSTRWQWSNYTWQNSTLEGPALVKWKIWFSDVYGNVNHSKTGEIWILAPVIRTISTLNNDTMEPSSVFLENKTVTIRSNITDPEGRNDIQDAIVSVKNSTGGTMLENKTMQSIKNITKGRTYGYNYTIPSGVQTPKNWTIRIWANDSHGLWDTKAKNITIEDKPTWKNLSENESVASEGSALNLSVVGKDPTGLNYGYLMTNETGSMQKREKYGNYNYTSRKCEDAFGIFCNETDLSLEGDNTFDGCSPDSDNSYENVQSVEVNVTSVSPGTLVKATATWDMASDGSTDYLYIWYYNGTGWKQLYRSANSTGSGLYTDSVTFTADEIYGKHWIRAYISGYGTDDGDSCSDTSSYYDNDDVNFTVKRPIEFDGDTGWNLADFIWKNPMIQSLTWIFWKIGLTDVKDFETQTEGDIFAISSPKKFNMTVLNDSGGVAPSNITFFRYFKSEENKKEISAANPWISEDLWLGLKYRIEQKSPALDSWFKSEIHNLNVSRNITFSPQLDENYTNYEAPRSNIFSVYAMNSSQLTNFDHATLYFPRPSGKDVTGVFHCTNWNFSNSNCSSWEVNHTSQYNVKKNSSHVWFNVSDLSAYGVGNQKPYPNITKIRIYDLSNASDNETGGELVASGLNSTFTINAVNETPFRFEVVIENEGTIPWNLSGEDNVSQRGLDPDWSVNESLGIFYNITTGKYYGGNFTDGKIIWNTSLGGQLNSSYLGGKAYFKYIIDILGKAPGGVKIKDFPTIPDNTSVAQNHTFLNNISVQCMSRNCGDVEGKNRYNKTGTEPDTPIPTTNGSKPLYVMGSANKKPCPGNPLSQNENCTLTWRVNGTGELGSSWNIDGLFSTTLTVKAPGPLYTKAVDSSTPSSSEDNSTLEVVSRKYNDSKDHSITITYPAIHIILEFSSIDFGSLDPGWLNNSALGNSGDKYNISVPTYSNDVENLWVKGTNITREAGGDYFIPPQNASWGLENQISNETPLTSTYSNMASNLAWGTALPTYYWIDVPYGRLQGQYNGTIYFKANTTA